MPFGVLLLHYKPNQHIRANRTYTVVCLKDQANNVSTLQIRFISKCMLFHFNICSQNL